MLVLRIFSVALVVLWSALGVSCSYQKGPCIKPAIRREWRVFSTEEKAAWIRAVNVRTRHTPRFDSHTQGILVAVFIAPAP